MPARVRISAEDAAVVTELRGQRIVRVLRAVFAVYGPIVLLWIPLRNVGSADFSPADYGDDR